MKIILSFLLAVALLSGFPSCQREVDWNLPGTGDSLHIDKFIEFDTSFTSGNDTLFKSSFNYDGQKRLSQITEAGFDAGTATIPYTANEYRHYTGNDTLPYRVVRKEIYTNGQNFDDTIYLFYGSDKLIFKDSSVHYESGVLTQKQRVTYSSTGSGEYIVKRTQFDPASGAVLDMDSIRSSRILVAGNVIASSDSIFKQGVGLYDVYHYAYNYDIKANPFRKIILHYPVYIILVNNSWYQFVPDPASMNNPTSFTLLHWFNGITNNHTGQMTYTYNSSGYPTVVRIADLSGGTPTPQKDLIFYRTF